jgi:RNA polymerase sigma-70 factor (ECF subfamily)
VTQPPETLVQAAAAGDRSAFERLVASEYDFIFRLAWQWTRNEADAEDIAQEVCIRLGRSISKFKGHGRFRTWLYTLVLNTVRDTARRATRERRNVMAYSAEVSNSGEGDHEDGSARLWEAVGQLPDKQKDAVLLVYAEGLTHSQASDILGVAEATISWHLHEARKRLKSIMGSEFAHG